MHIHGSQLQKQISGFYVSSESRAMCLMCPQSIKMKKVYSGLFLNVYSIQDFILNYSEAQFKYSKKVESP